MSRDVFQGILIDGIATKFGTENVAGGQLATMNTKLIRMKILWQQSTIVY